MTKETALAPFNLAHPISWHCCCWCCI